MFNQPIAVAGESRVMDSEETVPREVKFEGRTVTDVWFGIFYILSYIGYLVLGFIIVGNAQPPYERDENDERVLSAYFLEDAQECCAADNSYGNVCAVLYGDENERRLQTGGSKFDGDEGIFDAFLEAPEIIVGLTGFVLGIAILYGILLRFFSKPMVFISELAKVALLITAGVYLEDTTTTVLCFLFAFLSCVYIYWARDKILLTANLMEYSTIAMKENPSVFGAGLFAKLLYAANAALFVLFFAESFNNIEIAKYTYDENYTYCDFQVNQYVPKMWVYLSLSYLYTVILFDKIRLASIATIVGSWHFHPERRAGITVALKNTMKSFGTLSVAALISTAADKLVRKANEGFWRGWITPFICLTWPLECFLTALACCLKTIVAMLTKFAVILHVFTGLGFFGSGKKVFKIMSRHFKGGFVAQATSQSTLYLFCYAFSFCVALASWAWLDDRFNAKSLPKDSENYYFIIMIIGQLFTVWYPVLGLYVIILVNQWLKDLAKTDMRGNIEDFTAWNHYWVPPMAAAFVGCISMMFFTFLAKMFLDTLDTLFLCYAIDKDNGVDLEGNDFDELVKKMPEYVEADVITEASDPEVPVATPVVQK